MNSGSDGEREMAWSLNALAHPVLFATPARLTRLSNWHEHIPFAMFVIGALRPRVFVELGTYQGNSYCAFCQAVRELTLDTRCYAIDTWQGDPQGGFYGPEVLADLRAWHDPLYGGFSRLIQSTFDEALPHFAERTIDLLHIDGFHRYEQVKHDFESWRPKLTDRGVVLFHDINVLERDFGVDAFWAEVKTQYPHFEFLHGHGLGVLLVGRNQPETLRRLCEPAPESVANTRNLFFALGHRLTLLIEQRRLDEDIQSARRQLAEREQALGTAREQLAEREQALEGLRTQVVGATREEVEQAREELTEVRSHLDQAREKTRAWQARADDAHGRLGETSQRLEETERRLALRQHDGRALSTELAAMRRSRLLRFFARFRPGPDLSPQINPAFQDLLDDSYLFLGNLRGYRLQPSEDLQPARFFAYSLRLERPNLSGLMLAPIIDLPDDTGSLGIELATPDGLTLASARVSLSGIDQHRPARFVFPPVPSSARSVVLRVDVRDTATPVRLFEWRKRRFFGLGRLATRPFCGFIFE